MNIKTINNKGNELVLFFSGWASSPLLFEHLVAPANCDVWICYDYRTLSPLPETIANYQKVHLIAWSMGVSIVERLIQLQPFTFTSATAINGTPFPIDDSRGIPKNIFKGTLDLLNETNLTRFNIRMCGGRSVFQTFYKPSTRSLKELKSELAALYESTPPKGTPLVWTSAILGKQDRIFPAANQQKAWEERKVNVHSLEAPHFLFHLFTEWQQLWSL